MPLKETADPADPASLQDVKEDFILFYSSRDKSGRLWCPDCVAVEGLVKEVFGPAASRSALIVYVGQRAEWKTKSNPFRGEPWRVTSVPTIIRVRDGARLVDDEISPNLVSFSQA